MEYGVYQNSEYKLDGVACTWWWLRSPGYRDIDASLVGSEGIAISYFPVYSTDGGIRPAIWLNLKN